MVLEGLLEELGTVAMSFVGGVDATSGGGEVANGGAIALGGASGSFQPLPVLLTALTMQMTATRNNAPAARVLQDT